MESVIYYFSATGNSLRIANIMAERMDGLLLPMSRYKGTKCSSRQIGMVFPTYFWGVPRTVAEFVDEMKVEADNPICVCSRNLRRACRRCIGAFGRTS